MNIVRQKYNHHRLSKRQRDLSGFTIVEIIVVMFIISFGMIGVLSLIIQNIQVQYINKNNLIASQLAEEGVELIRSIRDTNCRNGLAWNQSLGSTDSGSTYKIDYINGIQSATDISQAALCLDANGLYQHNNCASGPFSRLITLTNGTKVNLNLVSINVSSLVQWQERGNVHKYEVKTMLYNWYCN